MKLSNLSGKTVALMVASGFDEDLFIAIQRAMMSVNANLRIVSREAGLTNAWNGSSWGMSYPADATLSTTLAVDYDALIIPAGAKHAATLSGEAHAKRIIGAFLRENTPILMIGDGADILALVDITAPKIDDATGVGVDGPLAVATVEAAEAGLEALNQAMVGDGESVAA